MVKILTLNVKGLGGKIKRRAIFNYCRERAEIICLQETHSDDSIEHLWRLEWGGDIFFSHGETNARGVCIMIKKNSGIQTKNVICDADGRWIKINVTEGEKSFELCNLYAPNKDTPKFFANVIDSIEMTEDKFMLIGDFNLVLNNTLDRRGAKCNNEKAASIVRQAVEELSMSDVWRDQNEKVFRRSYFRRKPTYAASRIDFALTSSGLTQFVNAAFYIPSIMTDHSALYLNIELIENKRGHGYWKFNDKHLLDMEFIQEMTQVIKTNLTNENTTKEKWEMLKFVMANKAQEWSREKAGQREVVINQLYEKIAQMEEELSNSHNNKTLELNEDILQRSKIDLNELESEKAESIIFRTNARWQIEAERNTKYFFNLEKSNYNAKTSNVLINDQGKRETNMKRILKMQKDFYQKLYRKAMKIKFNLKNDTEKKLSQEQKEKLDEDISIEEMTKALKSMPNGKTPGGDGLSVSFYKSFWELLKTPLHQAITIGMREKRLHPSATRGIISLIPKPRKDSRKLKNLRPISLLNVDFKIVEKTLANRIDSVINNLISKEQRGFIKQRRISANIRKALDIIQSTEENQLDGVIVQLDFQKCFDQISHEAILGALSFFGFGKTFIQFIKTTYTECTAVIQNNGHFSEVIKLERGVRQGAPNSSYLFLLCAELLAINLEKSTKLQGLPVGDIIQLFGQYADDIDLYLRAKKEVISELFDILEAFHKQTGFTVNYEKTTIYRIGSVKNSDAKYYTAKDLNWTNEPISVLGIDVHETDEKSSELNYEKIVKNAAGILKRWGNRSLSLIGKVLVINTMIASLFVYPMMALTRIKDKVINKMDGMFREFIWNGKKSKIALNILKLPIDCGGCNLVDLKQKDKALKISWVKVLQEDKTMAEIAYHNIDPEVQDKIWLCNLKPCDVKYVMHTRNIFWKNVLEDWCSQTSQSPECKSIIWWNSDIRIEDKPFRWQNALKKGLWQINQLYNKNGLKSATQLYNEFGLDIMAVNSLLSAIPQSLKKWGKVNLDYKIEMKNLNVPSSARIYYDSKRNTGQLRPKHKSWEKELKKSINYDEFLNSFTWVKKLTNITKYRSFQYRILQREIVTNQTLFKWKMRDSDKCDRCGQTETLSHMFVECEGLADFWIAVESLINSYCKVPINFNVENVLWNKIVQPIGNISNLICLIAKQFIYRQRCLKEDLSNEHFKNLLNHIERIEKYYAVKNNRLHVHLKKWHPDKPNRHELENDENINEYINQYVSMINN